MKTRRSPPYCKSRTRPRRSVPQGTRPASGHCPSPAHPQPCRAGTFVTGTSKHADPISLLASELQLRLQMLENMLLPREAC